MINRNNILETIEMVDKQKFDIRMITMGIFLFDCADENGARARQKNYDKITSRAERLVRAAEDVEKEYGIPIINKRISVSPISLIAGASNDLDYVEFARILDKAEDAVGVGFLGRFSALVQKVIIY